MNNRRPLRLYNSLGRRLTNFRAGELVRIFSCGPLVFTPPHLGVLRGAAGFDVLRRTLRWKGYRTRHVFMVTDIDRGRDGAPLPIPPGLGTPADPVEAIATHYTRVFQQDLARLNFLRPDEFARPSRFVPEMIRYAETLQRKGFAYPTDTGLYFDTARFPRYGELAGLDLSAQREGVRPAGLRSTADFALWRCASPSAVRRGWESPWGWGLPGAHIGCSTIATMLLGEHFEIHTGGKHHRRLHHVNEIAQSEAYLGDGRPWVGHWLHHDMLTFGDRPMVRGGTSMRLTDLVDAGTHPMAIRLFLLSGHYRGEQTVAPDSLSIAAKTLRRLAARLESAGPVCEVPTYEEAVSRIPAEDTAAHALLNRLDAAVCADLNSPQALAVVHEIAHATTLTEQGRRVLVGAADALLGLGLGTLTCGELEAGPARRTDQDVIHRLVAARAEARRARDWLLADRIRADLHRLGVEVNDDSLTRF
ncbi:hypothetical protein ABZ153_18530 [Streptomyces sp. NPDC006290]|jgi:cysteinyl-tRNA synthetase|uniref:hypothetical protein n=1 Tax=unclassified Streptomyces TaxID=2593676 RepID=UPI0033A98A37